VRWHREIPLARASRDDHSEEVLLVMTLPRTLTRDLPHRVGDQIRLQGWIHRRRRFAAVTFCVLRDRSGLGQVVVKDREALRRLDELGEETVVEVTGTAAANSQAPGGVEVIEPTLRPLTDPAEPPPVELWRPSLTSNLPTLLDHAATTWRHPRRQAVWRLAAASMQGFRSTLRGLDFTEIQTPKVVGTATESGANVFEVDWFGTPAYLAQSPQFYKQTLVGVFERVFEVGPVFRAEPHDTVRHLAEYVSLDAELGFIDDHRDVLAVLREVVAGMIDAVASEAGSAVGRLELALPVVPETIPVVHFRDALKLLGADPDEVDLSPELERALGRWAVEKHGSDFVAVEGYPMAKRPFYTHPEPGEPRWSNSFDLLFRGLELTTGGQRLHRHADYLAALAAQGESPEAYAGYLEAFAHGMPPHGGFALGLERWTARLVGAGNVRETTLLPRDLHRLMP
jgi:nondiscriminating aspartyl-tRNA synthetase